MDYLSQYPWYEHIDVTEERKVKAKFQKLDSIGNVEIKFSKWMHNQFFNKTTIKLAFNETNKTLNFTLIPALNRSSMNNFTNESIHFNWEAIDFKRDTLYIKINFSEPLTISPLLVQDLMILDILPKGELWLISRDGDSLS